MIQRPVLHPVPCQDLYRRGLVEEGSRLNLFLQSGRAALRRENGQEPPFQRLRKLGCELSEKFALFPPILLNPVGTDWRVATIS